MGCFLWILCGWDALWFWMLCGFGCSLDDGKNANAVLGALWSKILRFWSAYFQFSMNKCIWWDAI